MKEESADVAASEARLHLEMGRALSAFSALEAHIVSLFTMSFGADPHTSMGILKNVRSFQTLLEFTDVAVRSRTQNTVAQNYWAQLSEYLREISGDRNFIAHTPVTINREADVDQAKIGPSIHSVFLERDRFIPMSARDVHESALDFLHAGTLVRTLMDAIVQSHIDAAPLVLHQPFQRRRSSRKERMASERRPPKSHRRPSR